ncbi:MAG: hypothetical protein ACREMO_06310 [Gemmatimonadales bacterium]
MSKKDDQKLEALARKNAARDAAPKKGSRPKYDDTLPPEPAVDEELRDFFSAMKKREF